MLRRAVFLPPFLLLLAGLLISLRYPEWFATNLQEIVDALIGRFDWLFNWSTFYFLLLVPVAYFSPLGKLKIGGDRAVPLLSRWRWFAVTLCTTIATGILFWGTAEPIFHLRDYPLAGTPDPAFALSALFLHWTFTPYAIYTVAGLAFAIAYYNRGQAFSLSSMLFALRDRRLPTGPANVVDAVCLFALVAGMSASLGAGVLTLSGGLESVFHLPSTTLTYALICLVIVTAFLLSAATGLQGGIRILSVYNFIGFLLLAVLVAAFGPWGDMLQLAGEGLRDYGSNFLSRSTGINNPIPTEWQHDWTVFNWANWFAWAPVTALFLGRLAVGYTVRAFILVNWLLPSIFGGLWMIIFGGAAIQLDQATGGGMQELLSLQGPESIIYAVLDRLPMAGLLVIFLLILVFLSYVTAADSNVSAMSGLSVEGISPERPEAPLRIRIVWGVVIGSVAWTMISYSGVDGVKMISILGGFPAMFLLIFVGFGLSRSIWRSFGRGSSELDA